MNATRKAGAEQFTANADPGPLPIGAASTEPGASEVQLPLLREMSRVVLQPGDVIVMHYDGVINENQRDRIRSLVAEVFGPGTQCLVLGGGLRFGVVSRPTLERTS